ncbi:Uncharacterised protein [Vibrio cholerae]|nr:Uncharacterised protein [Vibrio cholerae]
MAALSRSIRRLSFTLSPIAALCLISLGTLISLWVSGKMASGSMAQPLFSHLRVTRHVKVVCSMCAAMSWLCRIKRTAKPHCRLKWSPLTLLGQKCALS